ncbi:hypothetical protein F2Q69_00063907 [Brassica cretica]|uniref:No apical meristem-associated C-terminal domain-containing protein n=1 Tax=Brassica cretica TaxID=69181 RepID=A0A8S9RGR5_BRACR|nr:hypothetical protein F2Q69_00063907 [Brassica cretica]
MAFYEVENEIHFFIESTMFRIRDLPSPKVQGGEKRESIQCKQRWQKINDLVSKFSGSYEAATRQKTSGMNENDVVKLAHEIFHNDHKIKFNLQHAWEELRFDQKWCEVASSKLDGSCKKRKCDDGAQSSSSYATTNDAEQRPPGVKASKRGSGWSIGSGLLVLCVTGVEHWNYLIVVFLCHSVIVGLLCHGTSYWFVVLLCHGSSFVLVVLVCHETVPYVCCFVVLLALK